MLAKIIYIFMVAVSIGFVFFIGESMSRNMESSYMNMTEEEKACGFDCVYFKENRNE